MSLGDGWMSMLSNSLPSLTAAPVLQPEAPAASRPAPAATGCALEGVASVVVLGDCHGDGERLRAALRRADGCVQAALQNGNAVHLAFLGNVVPCHHAAPEDSVAVVLEHVRASAAGIPANQVHVLLGPKDVGLLRFFPRGFDGELALLADGAAPSADDVDRMRAALQRPPPVPAAAEWSAYASALGKALNVSGLVLPATPADDGAAAAARRAAADPLHVLMLLKLEAMAATSYQGAYVSPEAPGLVRAVVGHVRARGGDGGGGGGGGAAARH